MTESGELLTVKGEFEYTILTIAEQPVRLKPGTKMIFVLEGNLLIDKVDGDVEQVLLHNGQHNLFDFDGEVMLCNLAQGESTRAFCIGLSLDFVERYLLYRQEASPHIWRNDLLPQRFSAFPLQLSPEIRAVLHAVENSAHAGFGADLFLESKVIELLALQWSAADRQENGELDLLLPELERSKMERVREILLGSREEQLSLRSLAQMVGTNEYNLKRNFKLIYGTTVFGYLNQHKMESAKSLLLKGSSNVAEVARKMGYKHATHFSSAFKKYFGYLPARLKVLYLFIDPELLVFFL